MAVHFSQHLASELAFDTTVNKADRRKESIEAADLL